MQKIIDKRRFKEAHRNDSVEIMETKDSKGKRTGVIGIPIAELHRLAHDDDMLELTGWDEYRDALIIDGVVTQADIDSEKVKPSIIAKLQSDKNIVLADPGLRQKLNTIRIGKGMAAL